MIDQHMAIIHVTMKLLTTTGAIITLAVTSAIEDQTVKLQRPMYDNARPASSATERRLTANLSRSRRQLKRDDVSEEAIVDNEAAQNSEGAERWFCEKKELKQDDHCERADRDDWHATLAECEEAGCWGKKDCKNIFCQTDEPTASPSSSPQPSPAPTTGTPTTSPTVPPSSSPSPPSTSEPTREPTTSLVETPFPSAPTFQFDPPDNFEDLTESIALSPFSLDFLVETGEAARRRDLQALFGPDQDGELISITSEYLASRFDENVLGDCIGVVLGVDSRSESEVTSSVVAVSYEFFGYSVHTVSVGLPLADSLDNEVVAAFASEGGNADFLRDIQQSEDEVVSRTVEVTMPGYISQPEPNQAIGGVVVTTASGEVNANDPMNVPYIILFVAVAALGVAATSLLAIRHYHTRRNGPTVPRRSKNSDKNKHYESFESDDEVSYDAEVGRYDLDLINASTATAKCPAQFDPAGDAADPDVPRKSESNMAVYGITTFSHIAHSMVDQTKEESCGEETLDGLYSDKDSYFNSVVHSTAHYGNDSVHSLDTLDVTLNNTVEHQIDGISCVVPVPKGNTDAQSLLTEQTDFLGMGDDAESAVDNSILGINTQADDPDGKMEADGSPDHTNDVLPSGIPNEQLYDQIMCQSRSKSDDSNVEDKSTDSSSSTTLATTDELYSRLTELETKIRNTERFDGDDQTSSQPTLNDEEVPVPSQQSAEEKLQPGSFSADTLQSIEKSRLSGTPPPSEGEVDDGLVKACQENQLLGMLESDEKEPEDSIFSP